MRKQNHLSNGVRIRQHHGEAIDTDALSSRWGHPILKGFQVILIHLVGLRISTDAGLHLFLESFPLLFRIIQLTVGVGNLKASNE